MAHKPLETPRTEKVMQNPMRDGNDLPDLSRTLEIQLNEARALLTRISDGAEPVLLAEEIEEFLDKTEINN